MKARTIVLGLLLTVFIAPRPAISAQRFWEVMPYVWFTGIKGTMTVEGQLQGVDASIAEVWENSNGGGNVRCETWSAGHGVYLDLFYLNLKYEFNGDEDKFVPAMNIFFADLAYTHELVHTPVFFDQQYLDNEEIRYLSFGVLAGVRYFRLRNSLEQDSTDNLGQTGQFIDPIVGGYLHYRMAKALTFAAAGDIGGFAVGSEFTWNTWTRMDFRITQWLWIDAMYRAFDINYVEGSGSGKIGLDGRMAGPALGLIFWF